MRVPPPVPGRTTAADLMQALCSLMQDCHAEALAIQDAVAQSIPTVERRSGHIETYQHLDRLAQIHEDLARLFSEFARVVPQDAPAIDHLSETLRLVSLQDRLFRHNGQSRQTAVHQGDVSFF